MIHVVGILETVEFLESVQTVEQRGDEENQTFERI